MATTLPPASRGFFRGLVVIIGSAAAASASVYALFDNFLTGLVPPIVDAKQSVQFGSFGTAIILLALSLILQRKLTTATVRSIGYASLAAVVLAGALFLYFKSYSRTYVYRYPPQSQANESQTIHVAGELSERGVVFVRDKTIAQAVHELGGPDAVDAHGLLWSAASKRKVVTWLESLYLLLSGSLTFTLFLAALTLWRYTSRPPPAAPSKPKRDPAAPKKPDAESPVPKEAVTAESDAARQPAGLRVGLWHCATAHPST